MLINNNLEKIIIWGQESKPDLMDWLYSGITGEFQLRGQQVVGR